MDAAALGYDPVLLGDCSATTSPGFCVDATIYNVGQCFGFVANGADVLDALAGGEGARVGPAPEAGRDPSRQRAGG